MGSGFDRFARIYRWAEYLSFGPYLHRARTAHLSDLAETMHALILGDGDGRFTALALRTYPHLHVTAIDGSAVMLELLRKRCAPYSSRLQTLQEDITTLSKNDITNTPRESTNWPPPDTVVTHFFLDCLTTQQIQTLAQQLTTPTRWIFSDFHIPNSHFRLPARLLVRTLYATFRLLTGLRTQILPDHATALATSKWLLQKRSSFLGSLLIAETWQRDAT